MDNLKISQVEIIEHPGVTPNPKDEFCRITADKVINEKIDFILAVGGGSAIDAGKAIALLSSNPNDKIFDYIDGKNPKNKPLDLGVILTSAATSSENYPTLVISNKTRKATYFSEDIFPKLAICNPRYTITLPLFQTALGAFDVYCHVIEQYLSLETFDASEIPHLNIIKSLIKWTHIVLEQPSNIEARANIMWSSTLALNGHGYVGKNPGWYAHSLSYPITSIFNIPHGVALAILLPKLFKFQLKFGNKITKLKEKLKNISMITFGHRNLNKYIVNLNKMIISWGLKTNIYDYNIKKPNKKELKKIAKNGFVGYGNDSFLLANENMAFKFYENIFK